VALWEPEIVDMESCSVVAFVDE